MKISTFIIELQARSIYAFSLDDAKTALNRSDVAVRRQLDRALARGEIYSLRRGFYLILPPIFRKLGKLPLSMYVKPLFKHLNSSYYVSTLSASAVHGASHQQIHHDFITTTKNLRNITKGPYLIEFINATNWPVENIILRKGEAGEYNVSDPILTIADLIHHQGQLGGLNRIMPNVEELMEEVSLSQLDKLLSWYPYNAVLQRMGYLFEEVGVGQKFIDTLENYLQNQQIQTVLLFPQAVQKSGILNKKWKIRKNVKIDSDLW